MSNTGANHHSNLSKSSRQLLGIEKVVPANINRQQAIVAAPQGTIQKKTVSQLNQLQQDMINQKNPTSRKSEIHGARPSGFAHNKSPEGDTFSPMLMNSGHSGNSGSSCNVPPTARLQKQPNNQMKNGGHVKPKKQVLTYNNQKGVGHPGRLSSFSSTTSDKFSFNQTMDKRDLLHNATVNEQTRNQMSAKQSLKNHNSPQQSSHSYLYKPEHAASGISQKYNKKSPHLTNNQLSLKNLPSSDHHQSLQKQSNHTQSVQVGLNDTRLEFDQRNQATEKMAMKYNLNLVSNSSLRGLDQSDSEVQFFTKGNIRDADKQKLTIQNNGVVKGKPPATPTHKPFLSFKGGLEVPSSRASGRSIDRIRRMSNVTRNLGLDEDQDGITKTKFAHESLEATNYLSTAQDRANQKPEHSLQPSTMHPGKKIRQDKDRVNTQMADYKSKNPVKQNAKKFLDQPTIKEKEEIDRAIEASLNIQESAHKTDPQQSRKKQYSTRQFGSQIQPQVIIQDKLNLSPKASPLINRRQTVVYPRHNPIVEETVKEEKGFFGKIFSFFGKLESDLGQKQGLVSAPNKQELASNQHTSIQRLETSPVPAGTSQKLSMSMPSSSQSDTDYHEEQLTQTQQLKSRTSPQGGRVREYTECSSPHYGQTRKSVNEFFVKDGPGSPSQFTRTAQIVEAFKPETYKQKQNKLAAGFQKAIDAEQGLPKKKRENISYADASQLVPPKAQQIKIPAAQRLEPPKNNPLTKAQSPTNGKIGSLLHNSSQQRVALSSQMSPQPFGQATSFISDKSGPLDHPDKKRDRVSIGQFSVPSLEVVNENPRHGATEYQKRPNPQQIRKFGSAMLPPGGLNSLLAKAQGITDQNEEKKKQDLLIIPNPNDKNIKRGGSGANWSTKTGSGSNSAASPNPAQAKLRAQILVGLTPVEALQKYEDEITPFEKTELYHKDQKFIYTIGSRRVAGQGEVMGKDGFYKVFPGEQIGYRYQVECILDQGAFGQAIRCLDMRDGSFVCLKISKSSRSTVTNTIQECKWLQLLEHKDPANKFGIVRMKSHFAFRQHYVICFELLGTNLYKHMKSPKFTGMGKEQLKSITKELLLALKQIKLVGVIHCDLKPENILFTNSNCDGVKIIDFGSSCEKYESGYTYVQSRFYRSPEVVMGVPYTSAIDMWSLGCILAELHTQKALFPAHNEAELLERMKYTVGMPPAHMIRSSNANKRMQFFDNNYNLIRSPKSPFQPGLKEKSYPISKQVYTASEDKDFIDFLEKCLMMDPDKRMTPEQGLKHRWITSNPILSQNIGAMLDIKGLKI